MYVILEKPTE